MVTSGCSKAVMSWPGWTFLSGRTFVLNKTYQDLESRFYVSWVINGSTIVTGTRFGGLERCKDTMIRTENRTGPRYIN